MSTKEANLVSVSTLNTVDRFRIVQQNLSRNVPYSELIEDLENRLQTANQLLRFRTTLVNTAIDVNLDQIILCNANAAPIIVTLPSAASALDAANISRTYLVKRINSGGENVTVLPQVGDSIDGQSEALLAGNGLPYIRLMSDGSNWFFVS